MNLLTHITSRFIPSSILIFAVTLSSCGGGGGTTSPDIPPTSSASSVSSDVVSSSSSSSAAISSSSSSEMVSSSSSLNSSSLSSNTSSSVASSNSSIAASSSLSSVATSSSSSSSSAASSTVSAKTGALIDSAVAGIHYETSPGGFSGSTNNNGEYQYAEGDTVVFSIGNLSFPAVTAKGIVTPLDMANSSDPQNQITLNIAALLQSLDTDGDPANGISINYSVAAASAQALNFNQPYATFAALPAVVNLTANSGSSTKTLVSQADASAHMEASLTKLNTASLIGTWSFQSNDLRYILFFLDSSNYVALTYQGGGATFNEGTYSWNKTTGMVTVNSKQVAGSTPTTIPFGTGNTLAINGDVITLNGWHGKFDLAKLSSTTNPLIGGWSIGNSVFAYTDTHYFFGQNGTAVFDDSGNPTGKPGAEYGTYSNSGAGFTVKTLADTNLQWGSSHPCNIVDTHKGEAANDYSCMTNGEKDSVTVSGNILDAYSAANVIANQKNKWPRNNEPEHYYFNRVIKNDSIIFGLPNLLTGSWTLNGDTFIFSGDNKFTHVKAFGNDPNCKTGIATGTYTWDATTFAFNVNLFSDSTAIEEGDSCSVGGFSKLILSGNTLTLDPVDVDDKYVFTKNTSAGAGLVGTWSVKTPTGYTTLVFTDTAYFLSDYDSSGTDDAPLYGTESGTYTYSSGTAKFTVLVDKNGTRGFSDDSNSSTPWAIGFSTDGDSFTIGDGFVAKRLK